MDVIERVEEETEVGPSTMFVSSIVRPPVCIRGAGSTTVC